jgi:hypothetical protein
LWAARSYTYIGAATMNAQFISWKWDGYQPTTANAGLSKKKWENQR